MKASTVRVAEVNPAAVNHYKEMRKSLLNGTEEERRLQEIVITSQLALLGQENAFKIHAMRLFEIGVTKDFLEQVILAGVGVTFVLPQAAQALDWIEAAHHSHAARNAV